MKAVNLTPTDKWESLLEVNALDRNPEDFKRGSNPITNRERKGFAKHFSQLNGNRLYDTKAEGLSDVFKALESVGLEVADQWIGHNDPVFYGQTLSRNYPLKNHKGEVTNSLLVLSIYRNEQGRYEFTTYIS